MIEKPFPAYQGKDPFIFVSYSHEDADIVFPELVRLRERGCNIYYDEGISPGSVWRDSLAEAISGCSLVLYFVTPASAESRHCRDEVSFAIDNDKQLVSVHLEPAQLPAGLRMALGATQAILKHEMTPRQFEEKLNDLIAGIALSSRQPTGVAPDTGDDIRSIAVMPLENRSADPDNEFLSDGVTEELINGLAHIDELKVASRLSVFAFKGKQLDLKTAATELGVRYILSGSLQRAGDRLRLTVQLADANDGTTLWSERYDRQVSDIFELQDDLARNVVDSLKLTLTSAQEKSIVRVGTRSADAYQAFMRGVYELNKFTPQGTLAAIDAFTQAVETDPDYRNAHACLAGAYMIQSYFFGASRESVLGAATRAWEAAKGTAVPRQVSHMVAIDTLMSWFESEDWQDWTRVDTGIEELRERLVHPSHPKNHGNALSAYFPLSEACRHLDLFEINLQITNKISKIIPDSEYLLGVANSMLRRYAASIAYYDAVIENSPTHHFARHFRSMSHARVGDWNRANADDEALAQIWGPRNFNHFTLLTIRGELDTAREYFAPFLASKRFEYRLKAVGAFMLEQPETAIDLMYEGVEVGDKTVKAVPMNLRWYTSPDIEAEAKQHPRFIEWGEKIGFNVPRLQSRFLDLIRETADITGLTVTD